MQQHSVAKIFPAMSDAEYADLKTDIKARGQLESISVFENKILDGWNRWRACKELKIEPKTKAYKGKDPLGFIVALNLHRRHLTESQRGLIGAKVNKERKLYNCKASSQVKVSKELKVSNATISRAEKVLEKGTCEVEKAVEDGSLSLNAAATIAELPPARQKEIVGTVDKSARTAKIKRAKKEVMQHKRVEREQKAEKPKSTRAVVTLALWKSAQAAERPDLIAVSTSKDKFNAQGTQFIDWAKWSWNPITGCLHSCVYCYARDIATKIYSHKFEPAILPTRLGAPANMIVPTEAKKDISYKNVFTCSMSDLFGKWVPREWIDVVLTTCADNPQWNFLMLTKFPQRLPEFEFPENVWIGTTVDTQARVKSAETAFSRVKCGVKWLSCEPLLEPLHFDRLDLFDWLVIGGASDSKETPPWVPPLDWLIDLHIQAREAGLKIYYKTNAGMQESLRLTEFPWMDSKEKVLPKEFSA